MAINSRSKGNRNERMAAALFKKWTGRDFSRTPSSGGLQWKKTNSKGDIVCTKEGHFFPFCVEVKAHKEIDFSHLINPKVKNVKIIEFWNQCRRDAHLANKIPLLLMRYDNMPSDFFFIAIGAKFGEELFNAQLINSVSYIKYISKDYKLFMLRSTDFFQMRYKFIKKLAKDFIKTNYGK